MYERFTVRARYIVRRSNQEAQRLRHDMIDTEHILLALTQERVDQPMTAAALVLEKLEVDLNDIRSAVETIIEPGHADTSANLPTTRRAKKAIESAVIAARQFDCRTVGTEHLLLGLLREQEGVAAQVLSTFGITSDNITSEILNWQGTARPLEAT